MNLIDFFKENPTIIRYKINPTSANGKYLYEMQNRELYAIGKIKKYDGNYIHFDDGYKLEITPLNEFRYFIL